MSKIIILFLFFILLILQLTIMPRLSVFGVFPNILLAAVLIFAVLDNIRPTLFFALLTGLVLDIFSSLPFGIYTLNFVLIYWLIQFVGKNIFRVTDFSGQFSLIFCSAIIFGFLFFLSLKIFYWIGLGQDVPFLANFLRLGLPEAGLNILVSLLFLFIFKYVYPVTSRKPLPY